jgi:hypothetical protein
MKRTASGEGQRERRGRGTRPLLNQQIVLILYNPNMQYRVQRLQNHTWRKPIFTKDHVWFCWRHVRHTRNNLFWCETEWGSSGTDGVTARHIRLQGQRCQNCIPSGLGLCLQTRTPTQPMTELILLLPNLKPIRGLFYNVTNICSV